MTCSKEEEKEKKIGGGGIGKEKKTEKRGKFQEKRGEIWGKMREILLMKHEIWMAHLTTNNARGDTGAEETKAESVSGVHGVEEAPVLGDMPTHALADVLALLPHNGGAEAEARAHANVVVRRLDGADVDGVLAGEGNGEGAVGGGERVRHGERERFGDTPESRVRV